MVMPKMPNNENKYICKNCDFKCTKLSNYNTHLTTAKHRGITNGNTIDKDNPPKDSGAYICDCGKSYNFASGLSRHKRNCKLPNAGLVLENVVVETSELSPQPPQAISWENMKELIILLITSQSEKQEKNIQLLVKNQQESTEELMNKVMDVIPKIGNTTNSNNNNTTNNTLNFYLTHTCKDAETIHDFTDRFVQRSVEFFKGNYLEVAYNEVDLASNIYDIFKHCLDENPRTLQFVQTTDVKNGVVYIKEKQKDANRQLYGEAEFIKYMDGFEKAGTNIGHAINCAFIPLQTEFKEILERECGKEPIEDDYEDDEDKYERDLDIYKAKAGKLKRHLLIQTFNTIGLFDSKKHRTEVLEKTRRLKD